MATKDVTHLIFTDVETTGKEGPDSRLDQIVELAVAKVRLADRAIVDHFQTLIRPTLNGAQTVLRARTPEAVTRIVTGDYNPNKLVDQGIDLEWDLGDFHLTGGHFNGVDWQGPGTMLLDDALHTFVTRFAEGATFAGQNIPFDLDHIRRDCDKGGIQWPKTDYHRVDLCSPAIFFYMGGAFPGISLKHSRVWAQDRERRLARVWPGELIPEQKHRAMPDVEDAIMVFWNFADVVQQGLRVDTCDAAVCPNRD